MRRPAMSTSAHSIGPPVCSPDTGAPAPGPPRHRNILATGGAGYDQDPPHEQEERLALLARFCHQLGKSPDEPVAGNVLRGFLIHNGVFIQGPVWKG